MSSVEGGSVLQENESSRVEGGGGHTAAGMLLTTLNCAPKNATLTNFTSCAFQYKNSFNKINRCSSSQIFEPRGNRFNY